MKQHKNTKTKSEVPKPLHDPEPDAAGIDVGANEIWVAVAPDRSEKPVRRFGAFTQELKAIVQWLRDCGIRTVAMESTGVYWIALLSASGRCPAEGLFSQRPACEERTGSQKRRARLSMVAVPPRKIVVCVKFSKKVAL
jgi:hypothetical protein